MTVCICCDVSILKIFPCALNVNKTQRKFTCLLEMPRLNFRKKEQLKILSSGLIGVFDYKISSALSI